MHHRGLLRLLLAISCLSLSSFAIAAISVVDDRGRTVTLPAPAQRIVSLAPHITELVYSIDAGNTLVGVSRHSDYPPQASGLPVVGDANGIDLERLLGLRPDLVLAWGSASRASLIEKIEALGLPVVVIEPERIAAITRHVRLLGELTGHRAQAGQVALKTERQLEALRTRYASATPVSVFLQVSERPLYTVNGQQVIGEAIRLCGGDNVFAELPALAAPVGFEAVIDADPAVIVALTTLPGDNPARRVWSGFGGMRAVRTDRLYAIDSDLLSRPTPRMLLGIRQLCERLQQAR